MALNRSLEPKIKTEPKINSTALRTSKTLWSFGYSHRVSAKTGNNSTVMF